jgi:dolichyl-diphosphooligosaccharide--protein glycosyltransferase
MAQSSLDVLLKGSSGKSTRGLLRIIILLTIAAAAVASRLFSVIRKSMILT